MSDNDDTMPSPEGGNPFPAIRDSIVGAGFVKTTNAEPYRFPYALACEWLLGPSGGALLIRNQIERMKAKKGTAARGSRQTHMQLVTSEGRPVA